MDRINGAGHVGHLFVTEDPATNRPPTEITDIWLNGVQEEICSFIESQGYVLDQNDNTLLGKAIRKAIQTAQKSVIINNAVFAPAVTGTGKPVYWDAGNARFDLAVADGTGKQNAVGFADVPNGNIYAFGDAILFAGLAPGSRYYLDAATPGNITTTVGPVFLGTAKSATELYIDIDGLDVVGDAATTDNSKKLSTTAWIRNAMANIATAAGFSASIGANGYVKFPSWLGSWVIQWAGASITSLQTISFPLTFPTSCFRVFPAVIDATVYAYISSFTPSGVIVGHNKGSAGTVYIFAVGN